VKTCGEDRVDQKEKRRSGKAMLEVPTFPRTPSSTMSYR